MPAFAAGTDCGTIGNGILTNGARSVASSIESVQQVGVFRGITILALILRDPI